MYKKCIFPSTIFVIFFNKTRKFLHETDPGNHLKYEFSHLGLDIYVSSRAIFQKRHPCSVKGYFSKKCSFFAHGIISVPSPCILLNCKDYKILNRCFALLSNGTNCNFNDKSDSIESFFSGTDQENLVDSMNKYMAHRVKANESNLCYG